MEKYLYQYTIFGQVTDENAYGGGSYNTSTYEGQATTQTGTSNPQGGQEGSLADTGFDVLLPLALGVTMIAGSVVALVKMHRGKKSSSQE